MKDNELLKIFIPLIAVVVIFESVLLVQNLNKKNQVNLKKENKANISQVNVAGNSAQVQQNRPEALDLFFGTNSKEMKVGSSYSMEVDMLGKTEFSLDALDLYVKYDPSAFTVSNLSFENNLKPTFSKVSAQNGLVVANFLVAEPNGLKITKGSSRSVMKFSVVPKKVGSFNFEIATGNGDKESVTMFIENASSQILPFSSNKLNINVLK